MVGEGPPVAPGEAKSREDKSSKLALPARNNNRNVTGSLYLLEASLEAGDILMSPGL